MNKQPSLSLGNVTWIHLNEPTHEQILELTEKYNVHEMIHQDIEESGTQEKIDVYDQYIFLIVHFPKYDPVEKRYFPNQFKIIIGKDLIISISSFYTNTIEKIRDEYMQELEKRKGKKIKQTSYYILYKILDKLYDKVLRALGKFNGNLLTLEDMIFTGRKLHKEVLENLLIRRRNIVFLKHAILPQNEIIHELQKATMTLKEFDIYFEDLQYKIDKIMNTIAVLNEHIETLAVTYNSLANIQTNSLVSILTVVTAIVGMMTMITGIYGMNIPLP